MAQAEFKRPASIDGVEYKVGVNEIDDSVKSHWFFKALEADGEVLVIAGKPGRKPAEKDAE